MAVQQKTSQAAKAKDLLASLTSGKKPAPKAAQKPNKPKMPMTPELEVTFDRFVEAHSLSKDVDARRDNEKASLNQQCTDQWVEQLWNSKIRPPTQKLETENQDGTTKNSANFIVADKYTFNTPERGKNENGEEESLEETYIRKFTELFTAVGMTPDRAAITATNFVTSEIDLKPRPSIDLFRWLEGHYEGQGDNKTFVEATDEERTLGIKIVTMLQCRNKTQFTPLAQEEYDKVVELKEFVGIKKGFLNRVCSYVDTLFQLKVIFLVIKPIVWPGQIEFEKSATPQERNEHKLNVAIDILGVQPK